MRPRALAAEKTRTSQRSAGLVKRSSRLGRREPVALESRATVTAMAPAKVLVQTCGSWAVSRMPHATRLVSRAHHLIQHGRFGSEGVRRRRVLAKHALLGRRDEPVEKEVADEEEGARESVEEAFVITVSRRSTRRCPRGLREEVRGAAAVGRAVSNGARLDGALPRRGCSKTCPKRITPPAIHSLVLCCFFHTRAPTTSTGIILLVFAMSAAEHERQLQCRQRRGTGEFGESAGGVCREKGIRTKDIPRLCVVYDTYLRASYCSVW